MKNNNQGIKNIEIGEIIRIKNRDWVLVETTHKNGTIQWEQPTLILLNNILNGINRKPYFKRRGIEAPFTKIKKSFRGTKLTNGK